MLTVTKKIGALALTVAISFCVNTIATAQTPVDDPGIGGPGSTTVGVGGDGGPVVPFDGGMSLVLATSGVAYASSILKKKKR